MKGQIALNNWLRLGGTIKKKLNYTWWAVSQKRRHEVTASSRPWSSEMSLTCSMKNPAAPGIEMQVRDLTRQMI